MNSQLQATAGAARRSQSLNGAAHGAAGALLAAVQRDAVTGDSVVEAGHLTTGNQGVCCIQHLEKLAPQHAVGLHLI